MQRLKNPNWIAIASSTPWEPSALGGTEQEGEAQRQVPLHPRAVLTLSRFSHFLGRSVVICGLHVGGDSRRERLSEFVMLDCVYDLLVRVRRHSLLPT